MSHAENLAPAGLPICKYADVAAVQHADEQRLHALEHVFLCRQWPEHLHGVEHMSWMSSTCGCCSCRTLSNSNKLFRPPPAHTCNLRCHYMMLDQE
jgi:hypothetical protein